MIGIADPTVNTIEAAYERLQIRMLLKGHPYSFLKQYILAPASVLLVTYVDAASQN